MTRRIESDGSIWEIDEDDLRYRRWPKSEAPREKPGWGTTDGPLKDFEWHPYVSYEIRTHPLYTYMKQLVFVVGVNEDGSEMKVVAPLGV